MNRPAITEFVITLGCLLVGGTLLGTPAHAQPTEEVFSEANAAYFRGDHRAAADGYAQLEAAGVADADVAFNRATAHAQLGEYGRAIQYFERALHLRPGDDDATAGLGAARRALARRITDAEGEVELSEQRGFGEAIVRDLSEPFLAATTLAVWALIFIALWVRMGTQRARLRLAASITAVLAVLATSIFGALLGAKRGVFHEGERAVIVEDHGALLEGPDPRAETRGEAREGEQASIVDTDGDYARVALSGGRSGWVLTSQVGRIAP